MRLLPLALAFALLPSLASPAAAQVGRGRQLNEPFALVPEEDVLEFAYSPDGARLAYWVSEADGTFTLTIRASDGSGSPLALVHTAPPTNRHTAPRFLGDGTRILFARLDGLRTRVYTVPSDGSAAPFEPIGHGVMAFELTSDETRLVYRDDPFTAERFLLLSLPLAGGPPIVLNGPLDAGEDVEEFVLSPDGAHAVYWAGETVRHGIHSAPVQLAGSSVPLSTGVQSPTRDFRATPDSARVVFRGYLPGSNRLELFSVPLDGSATPVLLSHGAGPSSASVEDDFQISPDGARVVFRADRFVDGKFELFGVPTAGSDGPVQLSPVMADTRDVSAGFLVSPNGTRVVWRADASVDERFDLFAAPADGTAPALPLATPATFEEDVNAVLAFDASGTRVAFLSGWSGTSAQKLFSVRTDGSAAPVLLDDRLSDLPQETEPERTPDGARLVYRRFVADGQQLRVARLDGAGAPLRLAAGDRLSQHEVSPDGTHVAFVLDADLDTADELFTRPLDGSAPAQQVSQDFAPAVQMGNVHSYRAGAERVLYVADSDASGVTGLFSIPLRVPGRRLRISDTAGGRIDVLPAGEVELAAGETRAVYRGWIAEREWLFSSDVARVSDPVVVDVAAQPYASVPSFLVAPDGLSAVFLSDHDADEVFELWAAPLAVQGSPARLSGTLVPGGDVQPGFQITPDGARVVYVADQDTDEVFELFSATGGSAPVKLSSAPTPGGDVMTDILLAPDGARVFFRADLDLDDQIELYSAPTDGSSGAVKVSGPPVPGTVVKSGFRVTPDGAFVLFSADLLVDDDYRLFRAPADGSAPPLLLSTAPAGFQVGGILVDPTGTRAVYWAALGFTVHQAIFSVPISGAAAPVRLSHNGAGEGYVGDLATIGETPGFQITPDGTRVLYLFDPFASGASGLYVVPIDRSQFPKRLNAPAPGDSAIFFLVDPQSESVLCATGFSIGFDLFRVPLDLSGPSRSLTQQPSNGRVGYDLGFAPDGTALYRFDRFADSAKDLFASFDDPRPYAARSVRPTITRTRAR